MRQVPHYLIIGNGCVAKHVRFYFSLLNLSFSTWHRTESLETLDLALEKASHVLLLVSDHAIETVVETYLSQTSAYLIHFSGSVVSKKTWGAHPLMTFNDTLYALKDYSTFTFVVDQDAPSFNDLLPGLPNPHVLLSAALKPKYHAMCVLSGNFSCMLWQKFFTTLQNEFNLPAEIAFPYLTQLTRNLLTNASASLTGPLVRDDKNTIKQNLAALESDHFQSVYQSFVNCYANMRQGE